MKKILYVISALMLLLTPSCTSMLDEVSREDIDKNKFMNDAKQAEIVLLGVYRNMVEQGIYGYNLSLMFPLTDDLSQCEGNTATNFREIPSNAFNKSNKDIELTWRQLYSAIYTANDFIEGLTKKMSGYSDSDHELALIYLGEAKALRALYYFELVRWYGNIPLIMTTEQADRDPSQFEQADPKAAYEVIVQDLKDATDILPWSADTNKPYRFSKGAAWGLLAKVYATWAGYPVHDASKWREAAAAAEKVITSGKHKLNPNFEQIWKNTCNSKWDYNESLIEVSFYAPTVTGTSKEDPIGRIGKWNGVKATNTDPSGGNPGNVKVTYTFINKWRVQNDPRYKISIADYLFTDKQGDLTVPFGQYPYAKSPDTAPTIDNEKKAWQVYTPRKWSTEYVESSNILKNSDYSNINWYVLRYSEVLLIYAEAVNEANIGANDDALLALNMVRRRGYGLDPMTAAQGVDIPIEDMEHKTFQSRVRDERAYELCFEGHRRQDLIRWGIYYEQIQTTFTDLRAWYSAANYVAKEYTVKGKHELMPIPQREMDLMGKPFGKFEQNPKW